MILQIEDKSIEQILQTVVKEEIEFLARQLVSGRQVRFFLWCWLLQNIREHGIKGAGIEDPALDMALRKYLEQTGAAMPRQSGGGGGGDTAERDEEASGGGGTEPPIMPGDCSKGVVPDLIKKGDDSAG